MSDALFTESKLGDVLEERLDQAGAVVDALSPKSLSRPKRAVKKAVGELSVDVPELQRDNAKVDVTEGDPMTAALRLPFTGDAAMFSRRPSEYSIDPPQARVDESGSVLEFAAEFPIGTSADDISAWASTCADSVDRYLLWQAADVGMHRTELRERVAALVAERQTRVEAVDDVQSELDDVDRV
jgi:hypothetical protein